MRTSILYALISGSCLFVLNGCNDSSTSSSSTTTSTTPTDLSIKFAAAVNGADFTCGTTYKNVGSATTHEYKINDFRFYLYDAKLQQRDGTYYPL